MAHGAGPRPVHRLKRDVAVLQDLECSDELHLAKAWLGAGADQRGKRADHILVAGLRAVVRLDSPDGDNDMPVDAVARLERAVQSFFFNDTATTEIYTLSLHDA